jgi:hypothetical protein
MSLALGASEMISKSRVTGSADIMCGLYSSMQLGFGLAMGENLVWWAGEPPPNGPCDASNLSLWWKFVWYVLMLVISFATCKLDTCSIVSRVFNFSACYKPLKPSCKNFLTSCLQIQAP